MGIAPIPSPTPFTNELLIPLNILLIVSSTLSGPYFSQIYFARFCEKGSSKGLNSIKKFGFLICNLILEIKSGIVKKNFL